MKPTRSFLGVLYPDSDSYDCDKVLAALSKYFDEFAYILHDRDTDDNGELKKAHIHWVGRCKNARLLSAVSSALGVPQNSVEICKGWRSSVKYLVHADDQEKFQYDPKEVEGNLDLGRYLSDMSSDQMAGKLLDEICSTHHTITSLTRYAIKNGLWSEYRRAFSIWAAVLHEQDYEREVMRNENDRSGHD